MKIDNKEKNKAKHIETRKHKQNLITNNSYDNIFHINNDHTIQNKNNDGQNNKKSKSIFKNNSETEETLNSFLYKKEYQNTAKPRRTRY